MLPCAAALIRRRRSSPYKKSGGASGRDGAGVRQQRQIVMAAVVALSPGSGLTTAVCAAMEVSRASVHRHRTALTAPQRATKPRPLVARALRTSERDQVLDDTELCLNFDGAAKSDGLSFGCVEFQVCGGL